MMHVLSTKNLSRAHVFELIHHAERLREMPRSESRQRRLGAVVATLFYEPSTRTRMSFEAAVLRLGGNIISSENARENSSAKKGETLEDVFRVVGTYADAIVIRHHETHAMHQAAAYSPVPIISAGAGAGEHPTQALLDAYTMYREFDRLDDLKVTVVGDLKYGRTVHSLLRLLTKFSNIEVTLVHPAELPIPDALYQELSGTGMKIRMGLTLEEALSQTDVVYQTRVQTERFINEEANHITENFAIGREHLSLMHEGARILHPLPRVDEIHPDVDGDVRAAYFRQVENGLFLRMALMDAVLGGMWS